MLASATIAVFCHNYIQPCKRARCKECRAPVLLWPDNLDRSVKAESKRGFIRGWLQKSFLWLHLTTLHKMYYLDLIDEQDKLTNVCEP